MGKNIDAEVIVGAPHSILLNSYGRRCHRGPAAKEFVRAKDPLGDIDVPIACNPVDRVAEFHGVETVLLGAGSVVVGVGTPSLLEVLEVGEVGGVQLKLADVVEESFCPVAKKMLLNLYEDKEADDDYSESDCGEPCGTSQSVGHRGLHDSDGLLAATIAHFETS